MAKPKKPLVGGGSGANVSFPKSPSPKNSNNHSKDNKPKYKGPGGYARRLVNAQIRDALRDIRGERRQVRRLAKNERSKTQSLYNRTRGDINHIFDETGAYIGEQNKIIQGRHDANEAQTLAAQNALQQQLQQVSGQNASGANSELERLGINAPNTLGQFAADAANNQGLAAIGGAHQMANLNAMEQGDASVGSLLASMNEGSRGSLLGNALNERNLSMADIQQRRLDAEMEVKEAMRETKGQRKDMVLELLEKLGASGWGPHMQNAYKKKSKGYKRNSYNSSGPSFIPYGQSNNGQSGSVYPDWATLGNTQLDGLNNLYGKRRK
jgi:hypothetical protein